MHPHPPCSTAIKLSGESGDMTIIKLIQTKYEGKYPLIGVHGEKTIKSKGAMLVYCAMAVRVVILSS